MDEPRAGKRIVSRRVAASLRARYKEVLIVDPLIFSFAGKRNFRTNLCVEKDGEEKKRKEARCTMTFNFAETAR